MNTNLCKIGNVITILCALIAIILLNVVNVMPGGLVIKDASLGKDVQDAVIIVFVFNILMLLNSMFTYKLFKSELVRDIIGTSLAFAVLVSSSLVISRTETLDGFPVQYNEQQVSATVALCYITGAMGLISCLICGVHSVLGLTKRAGLVRRSTRKTA